MKRPEKILIDIEIDKLTNSIENTVSGDIFDKDSKIHENWVQGNRNILEKMNVEDIRGDYNLTFNNESFDLKISGELEKLEVKTYLSAGPPH